MPPEIFTIHVQYLCIKYALYYFVKQLKYSLLTQKIHGGDALLIFTFISTDTVHGVGRGGNGGKGEKYLQFGFIILPGFVKRFFEVLRKQKNHRAVLKLCHYTH